MAIVAAVVATVDPLVRPSTLSLGYRSMARGVGTQVNLVGLVRHVRATGCCIVNLVVSVGLGILVNDESCHCFFSVRLTSDDCSLCDGLCLQNERTRGVAVIGG